jgi:hypothetical protein
MRALPACAAALLLALALPAAAPGKSGDGDETEFVTYDIEGVYKGDRKVRVTGGNAHARKALAGKGVRFNMVGAEFDGRDVNDDGYRDWRDLVKNQRIRIRAEFAKKKPNTKRPVLEVFAGGGPDCEGLAGNTRFCPF